MTDFEENVENGGDDYRSGGWRQFGGDETGGPGDETGDKTVATAGDNETVANGGVMYADEGPYTIDVHYLCLASIAKFCDGRL